MDPLLIGLRPAARRFKTQRDGSRAGHSIVLAGLVGQRCPPSLCTDSLYAAWRQVELKGRQDLDAEGRQQCSRVVAERRGERLRGAPRELASGLRVRVGHHERGVGARQAVEPEVAAL